MKLGMRNYMEDMVRDKMPAILKTMPDVCSCDQCTMDMMAHALNNCPPKYVVTQKGTIYAKLNVLQSQFDVDVMRAITDAAMIISKSPRHNIEDFDV